MFNSIDLLNQEEHSLKTSEISIQVDPQFLHFYIDANSHSPKKSFQSKQNLIPVRQKCISIDSVSFLPKIFENKSGKNHSNARSKGTISSPRSINQRKSFKSLFPPKSLSQLRHKSNLKRLKIVPDTAEKKQGNAIRCPSGALNFMDDCIDLASKIEHKSPVIKLKRGAEYVRLIHSPTRMGRVKEISQIKSKLLDLLSPCDILNKLLRKK